MAEARLRSKYIRMNALRNLSTTTETSSPIDVATSAKPRFEERISFASSEDESDDDDEEEKEEEIKLEDDGKRILSSKLKYKVLKIVT